MNDYRNGFTSKIHCSEVIKKSKESFDKGRYRSNNYAYLIRKYKKINYNFRKVYDNKCQYCGITNSVISNEVFEADHHFPISKEKYYEGNINCLENMVLSCHRCNSRKSNFLTSHENKNRFHPDYSNLSEFFLRDKNFNIKIKIAYSQDTDVINFYKQMLFDSYKRQLDYLILNISEYIDCINDYELKGRLSEIKEILRKKR